MLTSSSKMIHVSNTALNFPSNSPAEHGHSETGGPGVSNSFLIILAN